MSTVKLTQSDGVLLVVFDAPHRNNPFSQVMMRDVAAALRRADGDPAVGAVVVYGGEGRAMSVGGDFKEVSTFAGGDEVDVWIDHITELYLAGVELQKPLLAAVDHHAIGVGFQVALTCDYRIGADTCVFQMPEFALGVACSFGTFMLTHVVGYAAMQRLVFGCEPVGAAAALTMGLLHEVVPPSVLLAHTLDVAKKLAGYHRDAVYPTKRQATSAYAEGLREVGRHARYAHRRAFAAGAAQARMTKILHHEPAGAPTGSA